MVDDLQEFCELDVCDFRVVTNLKEAAVEHNWGAQRVVRPSFEAKIG